MHSTDCKYVICSVEKLRYLVGRKCLEAGCGSPIDVDYSSCLTMVGFCGNGYVLDWVLLDFHTNKMAVGSSTSIFLLLLPLFCLATALLK